MTDYLQRLFDRGGGDAPMPAAASMSPVAQADQRLTVPGIGEALMWQPPVFGLETPTGDQASPTHGPTPRPAMPRTLETPFPRPEVPVSHMAPVPAAIVPPRETAKAPAPLAAPQPDRPPAIPPSIRQIGMIDADDLELPTDADVTALPPAPHALPKAEPGPAVPVPEPAARAITHRAKPEVEPVPPPPATPAPFDSLPIESRPSAREPAVAQPVSTLEPEALRLAEPAPPTPMLAMPAPMPEPPPLEVAPPVQATPPAPAPKPEPRRVETIRAPEPPRPPRPLTANEVSVIGPLPASRRPATIFGVRRR